MRAVLASVQESVRPRNAMPLGSAGTELEIRLPDPPGPLLVDGGGGLRKA